MDEKREKIIKKTIKTYKNNNFQKQKNKNQSYLTLNMGKQNNKPNKTK